ncbi:MAG: superoxide dismutase [Elusimicrobia bacterium]|nr:superoxide dismutase [Elusimicrobiota bacterium]
MKKISWWISTFLIVAAGGMSLLYAHCEIPCGIYGDQARIDMMNEDIETIKKSMNEIIKLEKQKKPNYNQLVRWINNKEIHANKIQEIVAQYFMTQRIKPGTDAYEKQLRLLHEMLIYSMRCKQTSDLKNVEKLRELVKEFSSIYFGKKSE